MEKHSSILPGLRCLGHHRFSFALKYKSSVSFKNFQEGGGEQNVANLNVLSHLGNFVRHWPKAADLEPSC
jgi:hypothetical protein